MVRVNQTSHDLELAKQEIEAEFTTPGRPLPPPVLKTKIENYSGPIVVLLPLALRHLLAALKNEYGGMIFVVVCDCEVPDTVSAVMPAVSPAASIDTINRQYAKYSEAEELVNGRS